MRAQQLTIALILTFGLALTVHADDDSDDKDDNRGRSAWQQVSGTAIHYDSQAMVHSDVPTANGRIVTSTDIVELDGDLVGRVLYQVVSVRDEVSNRWVNTGNQVFSGTVLGSKPVMIHDEDFRFDLDLNAFTTTGEIYLVNRIAGQRIRCLLNMTGTGRTAEGDNLSIYWGRCKIRSARRR